MPFFSLVAFLSLFLFSLSLVLSHSFSFSLFFPHSLSLDFDILFAEPIPFLMAHAPFLMLFITLSLPFPATLCLFFFMPLCLLSYSCHLFPLSHSFLHTLSCVLFPHAFSCKHTLFSHVVVILLSLGHTCASLLTLFLECSPLLQLCSFPCPFSLFFFFAPSFFLMLSLSLSCTCCFSHAYSQSHTLMFSWDYTFSCTTVLTLSHASFLSHPISSSCFFSSTSQSLLISFTLSLLFSPLLFLSSASSSHPLIESWNGLGWK